MAGSVVASAASHEATIRNTVATQNVLPQVLHKRLRASGFKLCNGECVIASTATEAGKNVAANSTGGMAQAIPKFRPATTVAHVRHTTTTNGNNVHALPNQVKNPISGVAGLAPLARASSTIIWKRMTAGTTIRNTSNNPSRPPQIASDVSSQKISSGISTLESVTG